MERKCPNPECNSVDVRSLTPTDFVCANCKTFFKVETPFVARRIFISYGRDEYACVAERLKSDFIARGHEVWFDKERLKEGRDWEKYIEEGLNWVRSDPTTGRVVFIITPHSTRRPDGYCLNEIAAAIQKNLSIIPIMLVSAEPPLSICRLQHLDMQDCLPIEERSGRYEDRFKRLMCAIEADELNFDGIQATILNALDPVTFDADISFHLPKFTGRKWVFDEIDNWYRQEKFSQRVFWLKGGPGVGKTAISYWLSYKRREISASHFCKFGNSLKADPRRVVRSIAYQLSTQLPAYQDKLGVMNLKKIIEDAKDASALFDALIIQPLASNYPTPDRKVTILIDALDEASENGRNELARFIATEFNKTPDWLYLIITSRDEPEVAFHLQGLNSYVLDTNTEQNREDIESFLANELEEFCDDKERIGLLVDQIYQKSEGLFLYARWVCDEIRNKNLSINRVREFPQGLGGIYAEFFSRRYADISEYQSKLLQPLKIIIAAKEPLAKGQIKSVLGWNDTQFNDFNLGLGSLFPLIGEGDEAVLHPFHRTIVDWLDNETTALKYFVDRKEGTRILAQYGWELYVNGRDSLPRYFAKYLPVHLAESDESDKLKRYLTDPDVFATRYADDIYAFFSDWNIMRAFASLNELLLADSAKLLADSIMARNDIDVVSEKNVALLRGIGKIFSEIADASTATTYYERAIAVVPPDYDQFRLSKLYDESAEAYREAGEYDKAARLYQLAYDLRQSIHARMGTRETLLAFAESINNCGHVHFHKEEYPKGVAKYEEAIAQYSTLEGDPDVGEADSWNNIAQCRMNSGDLEGWKIAVERCIHVLDNLKSFSRFYIVDRNNCGSYYNQVGDFISAAGQYEKVHSFALLHYGKDYPATQRAALNLIEALRKSGDWQNMALFESVFATYVEPIKASDDLDLKLWLCVHLLATGRRDEAHGLFRHIYEDDVAKRHGLFMQLAVAFIADYDFADAVMLLEEAIANRCEVLGPEADASDDVVRFVAAIEKARRKRPERAMLASKGALDRLAEIAIARGSIDAKLLLCGELIRAGFHARARELFADLHGEDLSAQYRFFSNLANMLIDEHSYKLPSVLLEEAFRILMDAKALDPIEIGEMLDGICSKIHAMGISMRKDESFDKHVFEDSYRGLIRLAETHGDLAEAEEKRASIEWLHAVAYNEIAYHCYMPIDRFETSEKLFTKAYALVMSNPVNAGNLIEVANMYLNLQTALFRQGKPVDTDKVRSAALALGGDPRSKKADVLVQGLE